MELFRKEVLDNVRRRLSGEVVLQRPASESVVAAVLLMAALGLTLLSGVVALDRRVAATGWLVPDSGLVEVRATDGGRMTSLAISEGGHVVTDQIIATFRPSRSIRQGEDAVSEAPMGLTAPVSGRISVIGVRPGDTVDQGAVIATVVPDGSRIVAELYVPAEAIGFLRPEQEVRIRMRALPHRTFGTITGRIQSVSEAIVHPEMVRVPGLTVRAPVYRLRVAVPQTGVSGLGRRHDLPVGTLVDGAVLVDRRSPWSLLFGSEAGGS